MRGDTLWKWIIIGNSGVGKTSLLSRLCNDEFNNTFISTIGIDFKIKKMEIDGKNITVQIWDTAGQERFGTITRSCYRGANGVMLVFDTNDRNSFDDVNRWLNEIKMHAGENTSKILVGNKCDMISSRAVKTEEGQSAADSNGIPFIEASAKTGKNVEEAFQTLARIILQDIFPEVMISSNNSSKTPTIVTHTSRNFTGSDSSRYDTAVEAKASSNSKSSTSTTNSMQTTSSKSDHSNNASTMQTTNSNSSGIGYSNASTMQAASSVFMRSSDLQIDPASSKKYSLAENSSFTLKAETTPDLNAKKSRCCSKS